MNNSTPRFTIRQLLEAGVHFGHKKNHWNPKMAPYIFGIRHGVHIIDLQKTAVMLHDALEVLRSVAAQNGKILFVSTKKQASDCIAEYAERSGQYFVNHRWLGGMLTNWRTVSASINTLRGYEEQLADENSTLTKKEKLDLFRKKEKLNRVLGGIREMTSMPDLLFVIDAETESLAITEANKLGIPVVAVVDTNTSPDGITNVIPGNDDARKAIELYCQLAAEAVLEGVQESLAASGVDVGASEGEFAEKLAKSPELEEKNNDAEIEEAVALEQSKEDKTASEKNEDEQKAKKVVKKAPAKTASKATKSKTAKKE